MIETDLQMAARSIRASTLFMIHSAGSGHPGGSLSCADLIAYIFQHKIGRLGATGEGKFVLSKGHAAPALYGAAWYFGIIPGRDVLGFRKINSILQGHPHVGSTPWVTTSTGSLGQGFSVAIGLAMGFRHKGSVGPSYVLVGDGELQEGEIWEGAMCAGHYGLDNLVAIVDYNKMQSDDCNENIMGLDPLADKWKAFRWHVVEIDGHDFDEIDYAFKEAESVRGQPTLIIAHTQKGRGVDFMEGVPSWHGSVKLKDSELERGLASLGFSVEEVQRWFMK